MKSPNGTLRSDSARQADIRPMVARDRASTPVWIWVGVVAIGAVLLFSLLDQRRRALTAPSTSPQAVDRIQTLSALPPLVVPVEPPPPPAPPEPAAAQEPAIPMPAPTAGQPDPAQWSQPQPMPAPPPPDYSSPPSFTPPPPEPSPQPTGSAGPVLVIDTAAPQAVAVGQIGPEDVPSPQATTQTPAIRSEILGRRAATVQQGTLIPAVLETALDSTRPGFARAVVSRDISGFDGRRVLIPRGSRLFGEYQADLVTGQNRAMIQWTRLVRPDGTAIALSSPAADPQGRAGVEGRVDSRFLQRFASALLQTTLNIGASAAGRSLAGGDSVIVALPGSTQTAAAPSSENRFQPTLRVNAGTRVTVFVARDLEFLSGTPSR